MSTKLTAKQRKALSQQKNPKVRANMRDGFQLQNAYGAGQLRTGPIMTQIVKRSAPKKRKTAKAASYASYGANRPARASSRNPYIEAKLFPAEINAPAEDDMFPGSMRKNVNFSVTRAAPASGIIWAMYVPALNKLLIFEGVGLTCELVADVTPNYVLADNYAVGRAICARLACQSDVQLAGAADVSGTIDALYTSFAPKHVETSVSDFKSLGDRKSMRATSSLVDGAHVAMPPGVLEPAPLTTSAQSSAFSSHYLRVDGSDFDDLTGLATVVIWTGNSTTALGPPANHTGPVVADINLDLAAGKFAVDAGVTLNITRTTGGAAVTKAYSLSGSGTVDHYRLWGAFSDEEPGIVEQITLVVGATDLSATAAALNDDQSFIGFHFLGSNPLNYPALITAVSGATSGSLVKFELEAVWEVLPNAATRKSLPQIVDTLGVTDPAIRADVIRQLDTIPWAGVGFHTNVEPMSAAQASSIGDFFRKGVKGVVNALNDPLVRQLLGGAGALLSRL